MLVTGAAGGLGRACASRFAADGCALVLVDRDGDGLAPVAEALAPHASGVLTVAADIRAREGCAAAVDAAVGQFGGLDVVVNAAGVYPRQPVLDISADHWQFVFQVNVLGTYFMMIEAVAAMRDAGGGHIVNVASIDAFTAHPANAHYAATKAAVVSLTRSLAVEVAPLGVVVNSVAPGPMATETATATDWYGPMVAALPTGRPIEPSEIADVVAFLARPGNVSTVGENVIVSGGGVIA